MEAHRLYYVEVLHRQGTGRDNFAMGLELEHAHTHGEGSQFWMPLKIERFFVPYQTDIRFAFESREEMATTTSPLPSRAIYRQNLS